MADGNDMMDRSAPADPLDGALRRLLRAPTLPAGFRGRFRAALERNSATEVAARRLRLEAELREQLAALQADSVRLRWRTLGGLIGGAFAAGVGLSLAWPWLRDALGAEIIYALPLLGLVLAAVMTVWALSRRSGPFPWLP